MSSSIPWDEVKERYLRQDSLRAIMADYPGLTLYQLYFQAHLGSWPLPSEYQQKSVLPFLQEKPIHTLESNNSHALDAVGEILLAHLLGAEVPSTVLTLALRLAYPTTKEITSTDSIRIIGVEGLDLDGI